MAYSHFQDSPNDEANEERNRHFENSDQQHTTQTDNFDPSGIILQVNQVDREEDKKGENNTDDHFDLLFRIGY